MKIINIRDGFEVYDISDELDVSAIVNRINIELNNHIQLNLSGCLIDYPATSKIIDKIIEQLSLLTGVKKLEIITDFVLPMSTIVNWLFLGSIQFGMESKKGLGYDELIELAQKALNKSNIELSITIKDKKGAVINEVTIPSSLL
jgi:ACT domain-containing protein